MPKRGVMMIRKNKYHNKKTLVDGITFDSKMEARYYSYLNLLKANGIVEDFEMQKEFVLLDSFKKNGKTIRAIKYKADFVVYYKDGRIEVIDIKGAITKEFAIKRKLFEKRYSDLTLKLLTYKSGQWVEK